MNIEEEVNVEHTIGETANIADANIADAMVEDLNQIPISISIELSRTQVSLRELGALKNGDVLELNKRPNEQIDLLVSGKVIGRGKLVDVDGELGVRICSLVK
jgi:flagellar motor switch protein FliN/FliY